MIMVKTDIAEIEVHAKPGLLKDVRSVVYADTDMNSKWKISEEKIVPTTISTNGKTFEAYCFHVTNPSLKYSYCIEWSFN